MEIDQGASLQRQCQFQHEKQWGRKTAWLDIAHWNRPPSDQILSYGDCP